MRLALRKICFAASEPHPMMVSLSARFQNGSASFFTIPWNEVVIPQGGPDAHFENHRFRAWKWQVRRQPFHNCFLPKISLSQHYFSLEKNKTMSRAWSETLAYVVSLVPEVTACIHGRREVGAGGSSVSSSGFLYYATPAHKLWQAPSAGVSGKPIGLLATTHTPPLGGLPDTLTTAHHANVRQKYWF